ncbi:4541_t:CDS:2, partial [Racocetra persica]
TFGQNSYCSSNADYCFNITLPDKNLPDDQKWVEFRLESPSTAGWLGIGIGEGMSGYLIAITLSQRSGDKPNEPKATDYQNDLQLIPNKTSGFSNDRLVVYFRRLQKVRDSVINETQTFAWAYATTRPSGKDPASSIQKHIYRGDVVLTFGSVKEEISSDTLSIYDKLIISHASIMFFAWMVFLPVAVSVARFARTLSFWVNLHRGILVFLVIPLVIIGNAIAYVASGGFQAISDPHKILGLILFICLFVQLTVGVFHHEMYDPRRNYTPWWTHLHRWLGRAIVALAIFQVPLGLSLYGASMTIFYIYYAYVAVTLIIFTILSIKLYIANSRVDDRSEFKRMDDD